MHVRSSPATYDYAIRLIVSATEFFKTNALPRIEVMSLDNQLEGVTHNVYNLFYWISTLCEFDCGQREHDL